ncbi:MAG TPA: twin-arginine translocation signal domain-containing protein [Terriglobia bacterium]|nr:twin-arginine translocation signal domain-containing protein [Terriglobia bacterium]
MDRREFLRTAGVTGVAGGIAGGPARAFVPAHNWDKYDFGSGPPITDRLNQGPFPQYPPEEVVPGSSVVMATTPSKEIVASFGRGLITYITADMGRAEIQSDNIPQAIEDLVRVPLGQKLYLRPAWREVQPSPGRWEFPDYWRLTFDLAAKHSKRVAFRIQMRAPDFVLEKVPMKLQGEWRGSPNATRHLKTYFEPRYDHPAFQAAFEELNGLLAVELNGNPLVEFMDTSGTGAEYQNRLPGTTKRKAIRASFPGGDSRARR